jgi:hypothetical protein
MSMLEVPVCMASIMAVIFIKALTGFRLVEQCIMIGDELKKDIKKVPDG